MIYFICSLLLMITFKAQCSDLVYTQKGTIPILLTAPHGGFSEVPDCPIRSKGNIRADLNTFRLLILIMQELNNHGYKPYVVGLQGKRKYVDANRPREGACETIEGHVLYDAYHNQIKEYIDEIKRSFPSQNPLLIDIHGQGLESDTLFRGTRNTKTIYQLLQKHGIEPLLGSHGFLRHFYDQGWKVDPPLDMPQQQEHISYSGGFTVGLYGSHTDNGIDAIQLEFGLSFRMRENLSDTARVIAHAIKAFHIHWQQDK